MTGWELYVLQLATSKSVDLASDQLFNNLSEINLKLDRLVCKDLNVALDYLDESRRYSMDTARRNGCLLNACKHFRLAFGVGDPWMRVLASYGMCICYLLLGDDKEASFRLDQCVVACDQAVESLIDEAFDSKLGTGCSIPVAFKNQFGKPEYQKLYDKAMKISKQKIRKRIMYSIEDVNVRLSESGSFFGDRYKAYTDWSIRYFTCLRIVEAAKTNRSPDIDLLPGIKKL